MSTNQSRNFTLVDVIVAVWKSPFYFSFWFVAFFSLVVAAYIFIPRKYISEGKLFVKVGRSSIGNNPTASNGTISLQDSRETEVKSVVNLLESRELASRVVERVGAERILKPNSMVGRFLDSLPALELSSGMASDDDAPKMSEQEFDELKTLNKAIISLMKKVKIDHVKKTTVVSVEVLAQTPFLAQDLAKAYLEEYQRAHVEINSRTSTDFFEKRYNILSQQLKDAEANLRDFRSNLNVLDLQNARILLQKEIDQLSLDRLSTLVKLSEAAEKRRQMSNSFAQVPEFVVGADKKTSSLARDKAREALYGLQIQESELSSRVPANNLRLVALRGAISKAQQQLNNIPEAFTEAEKSINSAHQEFLVLVAQVGAETEAYQLRLEELDSLIAKKTLEIAASNEAQIQENTLTREVEIRRNAMMQIADRRAQSETIGALDSQEISNVGVAQPAALVPKKVFPSGLVFAILGTALSGFMATVMSFLRMFKDDIFGSFADAAANNRPTFPTAAPAPAVYRASQSNAPQPHPLPEQIDPEFEVQT